MKKNATTKQYIQTPDELKEYFFNVRKIESRLTEGIMVLTSIRKEILTDINQGKMILDGRVEKINFENMGGGVYRAYIGEGV